MKKGKLMASAPTLDRIQALISKFYCSKNIKLMEINPKYYQVHNLNGKIDTARVIVKEGRYRFEIDPLIN